MQLLCGPVTFVIHCPPSDCHKYFGQAFQLEQSAGVHSGLKMYPQLQKPGT